MSLKYNSLAQIFYGKFWTILQIAYESYDTTPCNLTHAF